MHISNFLEIYEIFCTAIMTIIFLSLLIGIQIEFVEFKYSLKNILERRYERKNNDMKNDL